MEPIETDFVSFEYPANREKNNTNEYFVHLPPAAQRKTAIFRRGAETFYFAIRFKRSFNRSTDVIRVRFNFGPKPSLGKGTKVVLKVDPSVTEFPKDKSKWAVLINGVNANDVVLQGYIPVTAPVGIWKCHIETNIKGIGENKRYHKDPDDIYVIFNPWCKDDEVYLENQAELDEYVRNEHGKIFRGSHKNPTGKPWRYGQFDDIVLPASVFLLDRTGLDHSMRGSAVQVTRAITLAINSADNTKGVLEGRWDGNYEDGTSPHAWTGSSAIMDQYFKSGGKPVKYGQCWVYSGAVVTICRALGIPCRSVTNYISAHDTNLSLTVDTYYDIFGRKIEEGPDGCSDSCWNYHVWNEVYMKRRDLPSKIYDGWQAIDATPQEKSENAYKCGPASVAAVHSGEIAYPFDAPFVFSEVNADVYLYQEDEDAEFGFIPIKTSKYHVGRRIVTKGVGKDDDHGISDIADITNLYKNPEGSKGEREAYEKAKQYLPNLPPYLDPSKTEEDVFFDLVDIDVIPIGEPFDVVVRIENRSRQLRTIKAILVAESVRQNGTPVDLIKSERSKNPFKVKPGEQETLKISVAPEEYLSKLVENGAINIFSSAIVEETKQRWSEVDDFTFTKPKITVAAVETLPIGLDTTVYFRFKNPLPIPLTDCIYTLDGPGLRKFTVYSHRDVRPKEEIEVHQTFFPNKLGPAKIRATFTSKELQEVEGVASVTVVPIN